MFYSHPWAAITQKIELNNLNYEWTQLTQKMYDDSGLQNF